MTGVVYERLVFSLVLMRVRLWSQETQIQLGSRLVAGFTRNQRRKRRKKLQGYLQLIFKRETRFGYFVVRGTFCNELLNSPL